MVEFGHFSSPFPGGHLDSWGAGPFEIEAEGEVFRFGDSDRFGPYLANRHGDPIANPYPAERSPFWRAHRIWVRGGRRLEGNKCIWHEPKPTLLRRIDKRNAVIVKAGEEDGKEIWLPEQPKEPARG